MQTFGRRKRRKWPYLLAVVLLLTGYCYWATQRPLPMLQPINSTSRVGTKPVGSNLAWPATGQAAVGVIGTDVLETHGTETPAPIASVAKVITALVVLDKKPLKADEPGPTIALTQNDVNIFGRYLAQDSSLVPVAAGENITQYQTLQAIMLPSANNLADSLAIWAYGSVPAYIDAANAYLKRNGLNNTRVGDDASGLSPATTSTASDLIKLGKLAMAEPVLAKIVAQSSATGIPLTTTVYNVNGLLGLDNIIGIKTGNSDHAGGVFVSASRITLDGKPVTIITSVLQAPDLIAALKDSRILARSAQANFSEITAVEADTIAGYYHVPWAEDVPAVVKSDLKTTAWKGSSVKPRFNLEPIQVGNNVAGSVTVSGKSVTVILKEQPAEPSIWWRLTHPLN